MTTATNGVNRRQRGAKVCPLYHVTVPENVQSILQDGFKDNAAAKGFPGRITHRFAPGVWLADVPPITAISVDQCMGHDDEAWIEVLATEEFYQHHMRGNEWNDSSWPTRQWLIPAVAVNQLIRRELSLTAVLALRLVNTTTAHHRHYTADVLRRQIHTEMFGAVQARWNAALETAIRSIEGGR